MDTKPLVVRVEDLNTRDCWTYLFTTGPVWIGCGPDAQLLVVRPFISLQHGCFRFDHHFVHYQDLDPGVGTIVDGTPAGNREVPLTEWTQLEMGDLRVTISRRPPEGPLSDSSLSPFTRPAGTPAFDPAALPRTMILPDAGLPAYRPPARGDAWDEIVPPEEVTGSAPRRSPSPSASAKPVRKRRRGGRVKRAFFSGMTWLFAMVLGAAIVSVAGLLLQYRGLPWMPPGMVARIPPWVANLFR